MKTLLMLGGSKQQVVAIDAAKECGYRSVLCDYLPDNPGQFHADAFYQVSTTDREAVLSVARRERISGVLAYASDPAAATAAYVAEELGLPTNPLDAVEILSVKTRFREFMKTAGLPCPHAQGVSVNATVAQVEAVLDDMRFPLVVKPTDSSGSKGVSVISSMGELSNAINKAGSFSRNGLLIIEEFIVRGFPYVIGGDIFVIDGEVEFWGLMSCLRDSVVPHIPVGKMLPSRLSRIQVDRIKAVLQELVTCLGIQFGELNVEIIIAEDGLPYVLELGARAGGNMIPLQLSDASNINLVRANVMCAAGDDPGDLFWEPSEEHCATYVLHSNRDGIYRGFTLSPEAQAACYRYVPYQEPGTSIKCFDGADKALGILFLHFDDEESMDNVMTDIASHVHIELSDEC